MDFSNFDIVIGTTSQPGKFQLLLRSDNYALPLDFFDVALSDEDATLRERIRFNESGLLAQADDVKALGLEILNRLFPGDAWNRFKQSRDALRSKSGAQIGLRIRLAISSEADALNLVPWEYCFDPERNVFMGLSGDTSIVRFLDTNRPLLDLESARPKLLVVVASPDNDDLAQLYDLGIEERLKETFGQLNGFVDYKLLFHASLPMLEEELGNGYDVLQFFGHGLSRPGQGAWLLFERAGREQHRVSHDRLVQLLAGKVKLCVLTACESAVYDPGDMYSGLAQSLVKADIPAVIGMQLKIGQKAASDFTYQFYQALAAALPIDEALIQARRKIYAAEEGAFSWGIPVLYLQSRDGRIWPDRAAQKNEATTRRLAERQQAAAQETDDAQPKPVDRLLEALNTLNFTPQINTYQGIRESSRAGAVVLSGDGETGLQGLNWLCRVLIDDVRLMTGKVARPVYLRSKIASGNKARLWEDVAAGCQVPPGDSDVVAKAVVGQLNTHSVIFIVEAGRRVHMPTVMDEFWSVMAEQASELPVNDGAEQTTLSLLIIDEDNRLDRAEYAQLNFLPQVEPISPDTFMTWHRTAKELLPDQLKSRTLANHILFGGQNGYQLDDTEGYVDDLLLNFDKVISGLLRYIGT